jgi:light-regulated signal transduction histidine kinase (bacteriophytochrome)
VEGIATPERLEDGSTMWHGYLHDVTDEYQNLVKLEEYRDSLERSNRDLEQFAYAASHDLRQPLRMVTSYAQLLERHLKGSLDEDGSVMLHYMRDGAQRMDSMLLSLLDYSRVGRKGLPRQKMALKESLDEALHFLKPNIDEAEASVEVKGEWPEVFASPDEMTRLFQNLISNSLKYRSRSRSVEIAVTAEGASEEQEWRIRICDNGIGIAPGQIGRLFQVFQRLHTREQYEGTGVGLAICRKIVERHGGEITVESEGEDQGTCFSFTLPKSGKGREGS